jgi:hypothetical protein
LRAPIESAYITNLITAIDPLPDGLGEDRSSLHHIARALGQDDRAAETELVRSNSALANNASVESDAKDEVLEFAATAERQSDAVAPGICVDRCTLRRKTADASATRKVIEEVLIAQRDRVQKRPAYDRDGHYAQL